MTSRQLLIVAGLALLALPPLPAAPAGDPFAFWAPSVAVSDDDRRRLDQGKPLVRTLPGHGGEVAIFAAVPVRADGDRLVAWVRQIAALKRSDYVHAVGRFSEPPVLADLAGLVLDDRDLAEIPRCRPGSCGLKLAGAEMQRLQRAIGDSPSDWRSAAQHAFRELVLRRVQMYLAGGHAALPFYESGADAVLLDLRFSAVLRHSAFLVERAPRLAEYLERFPHVALPGVESFVYWSKESFDGRAIVRATHVSIVRGTIPDAPDALVVGKDIFATRYVNASLGVTAIVRGEAGAHHYVVYLNRTDVDLPGGPLAGLVRWIVQGRVRRDAAHVLDGLRQRLESGTP